MKQMESDEFWDLYWEIRLDDLQNLGKKEAILAISRLIRRMAPFQAQPLRLLELGCGEGQIIGPLVEGHYQICSASNSAGVDYLSTSIRTARQAYPTIKFIQGDFTDAPLLETLGFFDIVILVNALHEVFSAGYSESLGEVNVPVAKRQVEFAFSLAAGRVRPGGLLVLFDGLEPPGQGQQKICLRFLHPDVFDLFETFAREYRPFRIRYQVTGSPLTVELSRRDFVRYITKSIFLGKRLWETERLESYQYYTEPEFRAAFTHAGLNIQKLHTLTVDEDKWRRTVDILTPGEDFPEEHILIIGEKPVT
jgi:SAM-dependent methyltransferase